MRRSVLVIISAMKSMCGVLYRNCTAIKSTFHRAMKRNGHNSDCRGEVTSRNTLRIRVSNPYYALLSMVSPNSLPSPAIPPSSLTTTPCRREFPAYVMSCVQYASFILCIQHLMVLLLMLYTGVLQVIMKACLAIHDQVIDKLTSGSSLEGEACCVTACIILSNI